MSENDRNKGKHPWPTKDAMDQVYENNLWGGNNQEFYSGEGSHLPELVNPYLEVVTTFLSSFDDSLVVCDLGCGDFNIGKELVKHAKCYAAVDIVSELIKYNKTRFIAKNLSFHCLDIAIDELPEGDCAIVRQVLQHLSNAEVQCVVNKLTKFKYIILTEHIPDEGFIPNRDIISGQGIRLKKQSGVNLTAPPFNLSIKEEKKLLTVKVNGQKGVVVTTLYYL